MDTVHYDSWRRAVHRRSLCLVALVAALVASSCGGTDNSAAVGAERVISVTQVPAPSGDVVLTAQGAVGQPNVGDEVQADIAGIESLGTTTVTVFEPFVSQHVEFTGVHLDTVLAAIGVDFEIPITWTALDDYQVHYTRTELIGEGAFLATRQNGTPIPIEEGGPIRVVFTDDSGPIGRDTNQWIWSLVRLEAG